MIAVAVFIVLLLIGTPVVFVIAGTGLAHLLSLGDPAYLGTIAQRFFSGVNQTSLMCIPFFIMAGEIMNSGGVTKRLLDFIRELVGWLKGGLAYAGIITAAVLSAILGSANAVSSILCKVLVPDMERDGYEKSFSGALVAASGVLGPVIPPSTCFVLYCTIANISVKSMFMAGIIPGILLAGGYVLVVLLYGRKHPLPRCRDHLSLKRLGTSFVRAIPALLVPFIIVGGILGGVFSPTESGSVACIAAIIASIIYREFDPKTLPKVFTSGSITSATVLLIIGVGNLLAWTMAISDVNTLVGNAIMSLTDNRAVIILLMILVMAVAGCVLEATCAMLILVPVLTPIAAAIGMNEIHFGIIVCIMLTIGFITPPVGNCLFVTSSVGNISFVSLCRRIIPFAVTAIAITVALAYLPGIVLFIPKVLKYL